MFDNSGATGAWEGLSAESLRSMHRSMLAIRLFEERAAELLEAKEINCPTHLYVGQEAVAVGVCAALRTEDYVFGNHRSHGHFLAKGGSMNGLMAELFCRVTGCSRGRGGSMHLYAEDIGILGTVPMVGGTIPIAVGAALSAVMKRDGRVSVTFFGDGATEEGVFHEAMNYAALSRLPVIFACENNFFSSHLKLEERRPADNLNLLGLPYSMPSLRVDGNDLAEVYDAASLAVRRARAGEGPTFLELRTYRWRGHVGPKWDLDQGIRSAEELDVWLARCPIKLAEKRMIERGVATPAELSLVRQEIAEEVEESVEFARRSPYPDPMEMPEHVYVSGGR
jgi:acetoin:2,6-dichlorophenolindophenol oxidoreductase subunit alpha